MSEKFQNKYRIPSTRLQSWDYGWNGAYFITICTKNRYHYFGEILNGKMKLSNIGIIADILWHEIKNHTNDIKLGEFIVMPNHIHGILIIAKTNDDTAVETGHALSLQQHESPRKQQSIGQQRFQNIGKNSISSIIGSYKSAVTKYCHRLDYEFAWQSRFWDHIIRNEKEYNQIARYITNNPIKWENDKLNNGSRNITMEPNTPYSDEIWMI